MSAPDGVNWSAVASGAAAMRSISASSSARFALLNATARGPAARAGVGWIDSVYALSSGVAVPRLARCLAASRLFLCAAFLKCVASHASTSIEWVSGQQANHASQKTCRETAVFSDLLAH